MCGKIGRNRRIVRTAAPEDELVEARTYVGEMLARDEARTASRVLAYTTVGRRIGRSGSWVYRLVSGEAVGLKLATWRAIVRAYRTHAEDLARAAAAAQARADLLQAQADAVEALRQPGSRTPD